MVVSDRNISIANLRTLIERHKIDEQRLRTILGNDPTFKVKLQTRFDLDKLVKTVRLNLTN